MPQQSKTNNGGRERRSYVLNFVVERLLGFVRKTDSHLEEALAVATEGYEDGVLDAKEHHELMKHLTRAYVGNGKAERVLSLMDASSLEQGQRAIERFDQHSTKD